MNEYVVSENIRRFRILLHAKLEPGQRLTIERLLLVEEEKLRARLRESPEIR
jgi:hypothetical protein